MRNGTAHAVTSMAMNGIIPTAASIPEAMSMIP